MNLKIKNKMCTWIFLVYVLKCEMVSKITGVSV